MRQRALVETPGFPARSIEDMLASLAVPAAGQFAGDGWRHLLPTRSGFHHAYNRDVASGGWEFHQLVPGLCLALTDMSARRTIPRRHRLQDQFVLSTMVEGCIPTNGPQGEDGCFEPGYSTLYGMSAGAELKTLYKPGAALRWVSIFIDRHAFCELTGLDTTALPPALREYVEHGGNLAQQSLALSRTSRKIVTQMLGGADNPRLRHAFLVAKSFELIGNLLADIIQEEQDPSRSNLSSRDHAKLDHAMRLLRRNIENPLSVSELAQMVGLTRQKLQYGFRIVHGDTVAQVRDRVRMEFAMQRLRTTDQPITEIAMEAGYEYLASFTRAFRGAFGMSPSQARRLRAKR